MSSAERTQISSSWVRLPQGVPPPPQPFVLEGDDLPAGAAGDAPEARLEGDEAVRVGAPPE